MQPANDCHPVTPEREPLQHMSFTHARWSHTLQSETDRVKEVDLVTTPPPPFFLTWKKAIMQQVLAEAKLRGSLLYSTAE